TIAGDLVKEQGNYEVEIGTPASSLLSACGYSPPADNTHQKIIFGGPISGLAQFSLDVPVIKTTRGIIAMKIKNEKEQMPCIRCSKCVDVCPANLLPNMLSIYAQAGLWKNAMAYNPGDCIECGCCSYVCVSSRPVLQQVLLAKEMMKC
ncbi:MAG: 4Fe-4S dicluster domain-containing protein, partial [Elusimicrobiota bacterium]